LKKLQEKADSPRMGLYLHVPFCARSCDFCHFYQEAPARADLERYLEGMERALARTRLPRPADTVFWGGGTPGLLPAAALERLARAVLMANGGKAPREWTVEMAPATVKADKLRVLGDHGVNRISMGVQSFQPALLEALGRVHSLRQAHRAVELLHAAGMENFNLDLIFAIPGQSLGMWEADLREAVGAGPAHISTYCLTFEEDTALWLRLQRGHVDKLEADDEAGFFELAWDFLGGRGFEQYEVSNYARPGRACRHNIDTWRMQEWLGIGPSASSQCGGRRWTEPHSLDQWLAAQQGGRAGLVDEMALSPAILARDFLVFGLRLNAGVDLGELERRFPGALPAGWPAFRDALLEEGLAVGRDQRLRLTRRGRLLADRIGAEILGLD
jgi:oxygen-independent coproporphyrinogen III oxidase